MRLTKIAKWAESKTGNCPAWYVTETGDLVVQGRALGPDELAQLADRAADETAVLIPRSLLGDLPPEYRG